MDCGRSRLLKSHVVVPSHNPVGWHYTRLQRACDRCNTHVAFVIVTRDLTTRTYSARRSLKGSRPALPPSKKKSSTAELRNLG